MKIITSENLDSCLKYADISRITSSDYGTFVRALVYTLEKGLPIEVINNQKVTTKVMIKSFTLSFNEGDEGKDDILDIEYNVADEENLYSLSLGGIGVHNVIKDRKSGTRTFYRYYINLNKDESYRFTFNRRISKV